MHIGQLNNRVTIEQLSAGVDSIGQPVMTWTMLAQVWASIRFIKGLEAIQGGMEGSLSHVSLRIRYKASITPAMRVTHGGLTYQIKAILPDLAGKQYMDLACEVIR